MDVSLPGSSVYGISQAKILEWVTISFSRGSSQPRDGTWASWFGRQILYRLSHQGHYATTKATYITTITPSWKHFFLSLGFQGIPFSGFSFHQMSTPSQSPLLGAPCLSERPKLCPPRLVFSPHNPSLGVAGVLQSLSQAQLFCNPMDCGPPGSPVHGILQARILEWVAMSFSRGSLQPGTEPKPPALQADSLLLSHWGSLLPKVIFSNFMALNPWILKIPNFLQPASTSLMNCRLIHPPWMSKDHLKISILKIF